MKLLDRYLARQILWYTLLVTAVLVTLMALFTFITEQEDVGQGTYQLGDALFVTALFVPQQLVQVLPVATLIGALLGLGNLARGSELIVIRASGVSVARVAGTAALAGSLLFVAGALLGEFLAPPLEGHARQYKTFARFADANVGLGRGAWVRDGDRIVSIAQQTADHVYGGIHVYAFERPAEGPRRLALVARAERATPAGQAVWRLENYVETTLAPAGAAVRRLPRLDVPSTLDPAFLGIAVARPSTLTLRGLWRYVAYLRANGLESQQYELAFWSRLARSSSVVLMAMLAVPFVFGPLRSSGAGSRTVIGILIGVAYFLVNRTLENSGQVYDLDPVATAWAPAVVLLVVTLGAIARTR